MKGRMSNRKRIDINNYGDNDVVKVDRHDNTDNNARDGDDDNHHHNRKLAFQPPLCANYL